MKLNSSYADFLHRYETQRITQENDGTYKTVLTDKAKKQMQEDRDKYNDYLFVQYDYANLKSQDEALKKYYEDLAKIMAVFQSMCHGDIVPSEDEKRLMEYDAKLYQLAKSAQTMAIQEDREEKESMWDDEEEAAHKEKMDMLNGDCNEILSAIPGKIQDFKAAQAANIIEPGQS